MGLCSAEGLDKRKMKFEREEKKTDVNCNSSEIMSLIVCSCRCCHMHDTVHPVFFFSKRSMPKADICCSGYSPFQGSECVSAASLQELPELHHGDTPAQ